MTIKNFKCSTVKQLNDIILSLEEITSEVNIDLESGDYRLSSPIILKNSIQNLTINGAKEGNSRVVGCRLLDCKFEKFDEYIFVANIEKKLFIQDIFVDDKKFILARYPNFVEDEILNGYSEDAISKERVARWANPKGGYVRALHQNEWGGNSYIIEEKKPDNTLSLKWIGDNNRGSAYHKKHIMVENIFEELDALREWFYDDKSGKLYIYSDCGEDIKNKKIEICVSSELIKIENCKNVAINNIEFCKTNRTMFDSNYQKVTRSDWAIAQKGAIYINQSEKITISNCNFNNIGGNNIYISGRNDDIIIDDCRFTDGGASGIIIFGDQNCCRDLSTWENHKTVVTDTTSFALFDGFPKNIKIQNCYFYNLGIYEKQSAPISISVAHKVTVNGCTIHRQPRAGINICDGNFGGHLIQNNDIFDTVLETGDHGPFNSWGRDRFWSLNKFDSIGKFGKSKKPYAKLDAVDTTIINHNRIVGTKGFGIDLDDGSTNYIISNNLCYGVGIKLREGFFRKVVNNLLINAPLDLHATFASNDDVIENNVVVCSQPLNVIILNKGYTTKVDKNLFIGANKSIFKNKLLKNKNNFMSNMSIDDALKMEYHLLPQFVKLDTEFGKLGCPKPILSANTSSKNTIRKRFSGMQLSDIDETVRSLCGIKDYNGAYVEKISILSKYYRIGVRLSDAIININDKKICNISDLTSIDSKIEKIVVARNQQILLLE